MERLITDMRLSNGTKSKKATVYATIPTKSTADTSKKCGRFGYPILIMNTKIQSKSDLRRISIQCTIKCLLPMLTQ